MSSSAAADEEVGKQRGGGRLQAIGALTLVACGVLASAFVLARLTGVDFAHTTAATADHTGRRFVLDNVAFEITDVHVVKRLHGYRGSARQPGVTPTGVFVSVDVAFRNVGESPVTAFISDSSFLGENGKTYGLDLGGATISNLQRDASGRARFVFDVSPQAVRGGQLLLTDCAAPLLDVPSQRCAVATIDLGLR